MTPARAPPHPVCVLRCAAGRMEAALFFPFLSPLLPAAATGNGDTQAVAFNSFCARRAQAMDATAAVDRSGPGEERVFMRSLWSTAARLPGGAHTAVAAMLQSEWHRFHLDDPAARDRLTETVVSGGPEMMSTSDTANVLRAALLGVSRLPVLLHLPADTAWFETYIGADEVANLRK